MQKKLPSREPIESPGLGAPLFSAGDFFRLFRKARVPIILCTLAVGVGVFFFSRSEIQRAPDFTSATEIELLPGEMQLSFTRNALGGSRDAQIASVVRSISEELTSDDVLARAVTNVFGSIPATSSEQTQSNSAGAVKEFLNWLNYGGTPPEGQDPLAHFREAIDIASIDGSFVLRISATLPDPQHAAQLANAIFVSYEEKQLAEIEATAASVRSAYLERITLADTELQALVAREVEIASTSSATAGSVTVTPPTTTGPSAELLSNRLAQDTLVREIASLRSELASREIDLAQMGSRASVLREARPPVLPDGPLPMVMGLSYGAATFVFLMLCLVAFNVMQGVLRVARMDR